MKFEARGNSAKSHFPFPPLSPPGGVRSTNEILMIYLLFDVCSYANATRRYRLYAEGSYRVVILICPSILSFSLDEFSQDRPISAYDKSCSRFALPCFSSCQRFSLPPADIFPPARPIEREADQRDETFQLLLVRWRTLRVLQGGREEEEEEDDRKSG